VGLARPFFYFLNFIIYDGEKKKNEQWKKDGGASCNRRGPMNQRSKMFI